MDQDWKVKDWNFLSNFNHDWGLEKSSVKIWIWYNSGEDQNKRESWPSHSNHLRITIENWPIKMKNFHMLYVSDSHSYNWCKLKFFILNFHEQKDTEFFHILHKKFNAFLDVEFLNPGWNITIGTILAANFSSWRKSFLMLYYPVFDTFLNRYLQKMSF